jgi:type IX secretion system PorP/SprF family membrane protein
MLHRYILPAVVLLLATLPLAAQQDAQLTHFSLNRSFLNPAASGSGNGPVFQGVYRRQWLGLDGAPETQLLSFHMPLMRQRVGVGVNLSRQSIGISRQVNAELNYAYRLPIGRGHLSAGMSASVQYFAEDYADPRLKATQSLSFDPGAATGLQSRFLPNFGFGLYYHSRDWYAGVAVPRLVEGEIDFGPGTEAISTQRRHLYVAGGYRHELSPFLAFHPQILVKQVQGAPMDADLYLGLELNDQFHGGINYRFGGNRDLGAGESLDLLLGFRIRQQYMLSVAYDVSVSRIRTYQNGTIEVMIGYFPGNSAPKAIDNPRFFD